MNNQVTVICYGRFKIWNNREDAIKFYMDGVYGCDGCEKERYLNIVFELMSGRDVATDGM